MISYFIPYPKKNDSIIYTMTVVSDTTTRNISDGDGDGGHKNEESTPLSPPHPSSPEKPSVAASTFSRSNSQNDI